MNDKLLLNVTKINFAKNTYKLETATQAMIQARVELGSLKDSAAELYLPGVRGERAEGRGIVRERSAQ